MPRCLLVYFSQGGSTAAVAERISSGLREAGYLVEEHNLAAGDRPPPSSGYDLLGVGAPVHYYRVPFIGRSAR
jgi:flavodoxin